MIPLEDNVGDIVGKAQRGLGISDSELAKKAGVDLQTIRKLREGDFDERRCFASHRSWILPRTRFASWRRANGVRKKSMSAMVSRNSTRVFTIWP